MSSYYYLLPDFLHPVMNILLTDTTILDLISIYHKFAIFPLLDAADFQDSDFSKHWPKNLIITPDHHLCFGKNQEVPCDQPVMSQSSSFVLQNTLNLQEQYP